jgi:hypothetical protein
VDWFSLPREDELFYSVLARLYAYYGKPGIAGFSRAVSGGRHWIAQTPFPCQLDQLAARFGWNREFVDQLIDNHTLLPFFTAFAGSDLRARARLAMLSSTDGLYFSLGLSRSNVAFPSRLRFCPACQLEMRRQHRSLWWRRAHQLPGIVVCAVHALPLRESLVQWTMHSRHLLVSADASNCPSNAQLAWAGSYSSSTMERLIQLARAASQLLNEPREPLEPSDVYDNYRRLLASRGLRRGTCHVRFRELKALIRNYWGDALDSVPGLELDDMQHEGWVLERMRFRARLMHPVKHLILDIALSATEEVDRPFGSGPWPCLNPICEHHRTPVIISYRQLRDKGKLHGRMVCACGYGYSLSRQLDGTIGKPRFRSFGPTLQPYLLKAIAEGRSLRAIAKSLAIDPKTLIREAQIQDIIIPWKTKPSGRVGLKTAAAGSRNI